MQRQSWDDQYLKGIWKTDNTGRSQHTIDRVENLCDGGLLVEFGCGEGSLPTTISNLAYKKYIGIDISGVAIERAKVRCRNLPNCFFYQGDMATWNGEADVKLIVMEECLYYLKGRDLTEFLKKCYTSLAKVGFMLVIVHSTSKHKATLNACRSIFNVVEEEIISERTYLTLSS